jgi:hypothetical protein
MLTFEWEFQRFLKMPLNGQFVQSGNDKYQMDLKKLKKKNRAFHKNLEKTEP